MIRLLIRLVLACILCAALSLCGCTSQHGNTTAIKPWPPDTMWFVRSSGVNYIAYTRWPPDTSSGTYELSLMKQPPPGLIIDTIPNTRTPKTALVHPQALGEVPTGWWPPETLRVARVHLIPKSPSY